MSVSPAPLEAPHYEQQGARWGIVQALIAFVVAFVVQNVGGAALYVLARPLYNHHLLLFELIAYQFLALGVAGAVAILLGNWHLSLSDLGFRNPGLPAILAMPVVVIAIFLGLRLLYAAFHVFFPHYGLQGNAKDLFPSGVKGLPLQVTVLLWAGIEAPLVEETLFRGIIYQGVRNTFLKYVPRQVAIGGAALLSGCVFGVVHPEPHAWPLLIFVGIVLAYVFQTTRSLFASSLVHGIINGVAAFQLFGAS